MSTSEASNLYGQKLAEAVYCEVLGYRKFVQPDREASQGGPRVILFKSDPYALGWKPEQLRPYTDADAHLPIDQGRGILLDPVQEWEAFGRVLDRMQDRGWNLTLEASDCAATATYWMNPPDLLCHINVSEVGGGIREAVCRAAVSAVRAKATQQGIDP